MNIANKLTVLRMLLVPLFMLALLNNVVPVHFLWALLIFCIAAITDCIDGKIARKQGIVTDFGKFLDPLADKILVMAAFICFVQLGFASAVAVVIILFREFAVTSVRLVAANKGKVVAANIWGKAKTVTQMLAIIAIMAMQSFLELSAGKFIRLSTAAQLSDIFAVVSSVLLWISVIATVVSGCVYIWQNRELIKQAK